ncbi:RNA polymerase sigma factor [Armatimonas sp.]|uniref:RNA polymerase sigma factor n=1 Tax=Armatimonas sp. TaxID=1872638 RepID=UPI003753302D
MNTLLAAAETKPDPAFERAWNRHRDRVWRLVVRLSGSREAADDLTQEVALQAAQAFPKFRGQAKAFTLFYKIAVRCVLRCREQRNLGTDMLLESIPAPHTDPTMALAVQAALSTLPDDQRTVLVLAVYEQLSYKEIAAVLEIPLGTVMSRLSRARQQLRKELSDAL